MASRFIFLPLALSLLAACGSTPKLVLDIRSEPAGAQVYLSRSGQKSFRGKLGPVQGDVRAEDLEERFQLLGTTPLEYSSPLEERESGGTLFGVGAGVVREYHSGLVRVEKEGFATVERRVRFQNGRVVVDVRLPAEVSGEQDATAAPE